MIGRSTTCNVSGYNREVIHQTRVYPLEKRRLIANFNGAIEPARTIVQAQWDIDAPCGINISNGAIATDQRSTSVIVSAGWSGDNVIRVVATFDDGSQMAQNFYVACLWAGWFNDVFPTTQATRIVVTAP